MVDVLAGKDVGTRLLATGLSGAALVPGREAAQTGLVGVN